MGVPTKEMHLGGRVGEGVFSKVFPYISNGLPTED